MGRERRIGRKDRKRKRRKRLREKVFTQQSTTIPFRNFSSKKNVKKPKKERTLLFIIIMKLETFCERQTNFLVWYSSLKKIKNDNLQLVCISIVRFILSTNI
jgi:hypothetical protein